MSGTLVLTDIHSILQSHVLKLNKHWQALGIITVKDAIQNMLSGRFMALRCETDLVAPVTIDEWLGLDVQPDQPFIQTVSLKIRVPRVIITPRFEKLSIKPPKLTLKNLRIRDQDTCIYTGKKLKQGEMSIEHLVPVSKNGKHEWENVALAHRDINSKRGNMDLDKAGLCPRYQPFAPRPRKPQEVIENLYNFPEWEIFLGKSY